MTVSSEINKSGPYTGNGATTVFPYTFRIVDASHIEVVKTVNGVDSTVSPSGYTVSGVGSVSGSVVFLVAPVSGEKITIIRNVPFTQQTDLENQGAYYAETIEQALDLAAMRDQQLAEEMARAVKLPVGATGGFNADELVESLLFLGDLYLGPKASAPAVDNQDAPLKVGAVYWDTGSSQMFTWAGDEWKPTFLTGNTVRSLVTATGGQTIVAAPTYLVGKNTISIYLNGIKLMVVSDYAETDQNTITMTAGLTSGDEVEMIVLQSYPVGTIDTAGVQTPVGVSLARLDELREGTVAELLADTALIPASVPVGSVIEAGGFRYAVAATGAADHHLTTAGGVKLYVLAGADGSFTDVAFGCDGVTDATLQAAVTNCAGKRLLITVSHAWTTAVSQLTISGVGTSVTFMPGVQFSYATATNKGIIVSGTNCKLVDFDILAPATFDGTNVMPTYANIWVDGEGCQITRPKLTNVPKVGIFFRNVNGGRVYQPQIVGNYPYASYTLITTGHAGILIDGNGTGRQGDVQVAGGSIDSCIQGVLIADYSPSGLSQGVLVSGVSFYNCFNHGVYSAAVANGVIASFNSFINCQVPIALTGKYHSVIGNVMQTGGATGTTNQETGISMRDSEGCVIVGNTLEGTTASVSTVINLTVTLGTVVRNNIVSGNIIKITGSVSAIMVSVGGATATDVSNNIVTGNVIEGPGRASVGLIFMQAASGAICHGCDVSNNTLTITSGSHGVQLVGMSGTTVVNNRTRLHHDAGSLLALSGVLMTDCTNCFVGTNTIVVPAAWGTNVTYRGISESGAASSGNRTANNNIKLDPTKLTSATALVGLSGSGLIVNETGAGAPNLNAGVGSQWVRTDGASGTTLYIKEAGTAATGWAASQGIVGTASATYDPPSLATLTGTTPSLTVTGAALGDFVIVSFSLDLQGIQLHGYVSAANTVSVRFFNGTAGAIDLASGTLKARVLR